MQQAIFGGGCFWCTESVFLHVKGVQKVESGYAGGQRANPSYEQICTGATGHAEVIRIDFDESELSFDLLLDVFFATHDPTTLNRQGNDVGTQYRSEIFCLDDDQYLIADAMRRKFNKEIFNDKIVTSISMAGNFWIAEEYHQKYVRKKKNMIF